MIDALGVGPERLAGYGATFDAIVLLHRGQHGQALDRLTDEPEDLRRWISGLWRQWFAALKAEAAVLIGRSDAGERLDRARISPTIRSPRRSWTEPSALLEDDRDLLPQRPRSMPLPVPYQQARTLVLAGGVERDDGVAMLTAMGIAPRQGRDVTYPPAPRGDDADVLHGITVPIRTVAWRIPPTRRRSSGHARKRTCWRSTAPAGKSGLAFVSGSPSCSERDR